MLKFSKSKITSLLSTSFVFYLILMIGFNEPAFAPFVWTDQTSAKSPSSTNQLLAVSAVDANTAWAVGSGGDIYYTTDGGTTWTSQISAKTCPITGNPCPSNPLFGVSAVDKNTAWAVGAEIYYTTDGGATWTE